MPRTSEDLIVPPPAARVLAEWRAVLTVSAASPTRWCALSAELAPRERERAGALELRDLAFRYEVRLRARVGEREWSAGAGLDSDLADDLFHPDSMEPCTAWIPAGTVADVVVDFRLTLAREPARAARSIREFTGSATVTLQPGARVELVLAPCETLAGPPFDPPVLEDLHPLPAGPVLTPAPAPPGTHYAAVPDVGALVIEPDGTLRGLTPGGESFPLRVGGLRKDERPMALVAGPRGAVALVCQSPRLEFVLALFELARPAHAVIARNVPVMPVDHWTARHGFDAEGRRFAYPHYPNGLGWLDLARGRASVHPGGVAARWIPSAVSVEGDTVCALADGVLRRLAPASGRWTTVGELPWFTAVNARAGRAATSAQHAQAGMGAPWSAVTWCDLDGGGEGGGTAWVRDELTAVRVLDDGLLVAFGRHAWVIDPLGARPTRLGAHTAPFLFDAAITRHGASWRLWPAVPGLPWYLEFPGRVVAR